MHHHSLLPLFPPLLQLQPWRFMDAQFLICFMFCLEEDTAVQSYFVRKNVTLHLIA